MTVRLSGPPPGALGSRVDLALLRKRARCVLRAIDEVRSEVSITLANDHDMAELNGRYRNRARSTDVLSFSLVEGEHASRRGRLLGDVVIGIETAARQARARRSALDDTVARLLVHGVLHLVGHDHQRDDEARAMRAEERRLWRLLRE